MVIGTRLGRAALAALALTAAAPGLRAQSTGTNGIYDVAVSATGEYTARTGPSHPTPGLNVFYNGVVLVPGTTWNSVRSYDSSREWVLKTTGFFPPSPSPGFSCLGIASAGAAAVTPITDGAGRTTGVRNEWRIASGVDNLQVAQEVNAEGTVFEDSVVRITICITNNAAVDASVGIRYQWDWQIGGIDGPYIGIRPPHPPTEPFIGTETDFANPTFDFYDVSNTQDPTTNPPFYRIGGTVNGPPLSMGPTPPELVQYALWPGAQGNCFTYGIAGRPAGGSDSCVTYYWGATPATSILLPPGETYCVTQYVFVFTSEPPLNCTVRAAATGGTICETGSVTLDASASTSTDCAGGLEYRFIDPTGAVARDWSPDPLFDARQKGPWTVEVRCATDAACMNATTADVLLETAPSLYGGIAVDVASCNLGIRVSWDPASWGSGVSAGHYDLYRSETSCADALTRPPLVPGVADTFYNDYETVRGGTYYYVVFAENGEISRACTPTGPRGGLYSTLCLAPATDVADPTPPAHFCWPLRVSRAGDQVTLDWSRGRALAAGEHVHVLKAVDDASRTFAAVNPEGDRSSTWTETDLSSRLQFWDVRLANECEILSPDDEPQGFDPPPGVPCP